MDRSDFTKLEQDIETIISCRFTHLSRKLQAISTRLKEEVYHYDWVGFYHLSFDETELHLGQFDGADTDHTTIALGQGICGQVAERGKTKVVQNVNNEDNYLACSVDVQSEIVVPIMKEGELVSMIDIDSHSSAPFTENDIRLLERISKHLSQLF